MIDSYPMRSMTYAWSRIVDYIKRENLPDMEISKLFLKLFKEFMEYKGKLDL